MNLPHMNGSINITNQSKGTFKKVDPNRRKDYPTRREVHPNREEVHPKIKSSPETTRSSPESGKSSPGNQEFTRNHKKFTRTAAEFTRKSLHPLSHLTFSAYKKNSFNKMLQTHIRGFEVSAAGWNK